MIVLSGTIGAGKTSLTTMLAEHLGSNAYYESVDDNPILPLFYDDPKRYGFLLQNYFLNKRLESIKEAQTSPLNVIDRSIYEDRLLFQLNADLGRATQIEASTYSDLLNNMMEQVDTSSDAQTKDPDLLIHISVSFETMLERIKRRGRDFEQIENDPSLYEYYKELTERYTKWFEAYDRSPKLQIDGDKYDFVEDEAAAQAVLKQVDDALAELNLKA
ncbi:Deoxyguanosine kinase [Weissella viridescens]|jgi:deoxyadenosine/deoxycytidine kinase|uniref:Deoxyadenosine kinase n=2 Tax=Weissella viridescens TaxID=1629 RepID=A0A0R2H762_WEIVI|nr:deoxynucleoside kinase [Weissella viridescens]KRN46405.1 deoxyadenosine kinase [Weissella viridescens]MCB6840697.1 deoxynucleoside kinase [Weissella viridescens]MCB6847430.1 deoxynucleoside kinase [Weissella viridescens]QOD86175.1 deoxynucleoside kinase [Weissella viridescens]WJI91303.1 deoxynucleoside kinase [Weissella viridescens]